jgi:3-hydroxyisobutyrate dehydrogenase-like beta-hydroxyacid dehydrogenase
MRVGFAGLGRMGLPMERNLTRAGFAVTVWNRAPGKAEAQALTRAVGIDAPAVFDVIEAGAVAAPMLSDRRPLYLYLEQAQMRHLYRLAGAQGH